MSLLTRLLNVFYKTRVPCYPIVEVSKGKAPVDWKLIGWITRNRLDPWMSDMDRFHKQYEQIPEEILEPIIPKSLRENFNQIEKIPVLDLQGIQVAEYSYQDILHILKHNIDANKDGNAKVDQEKLQKPASNDLARENVLDQRAKMSTLILGSIPIAMYATDMEGNTIFYNHEFEKSILSKKQLSDSIRVAENFFRELSIQILSNAYSSNDKTNFRIYEASLDCEIRMRNLIQDGRITGYLYLIEKPGQSDTTYIWQKRLKENGQLESLIEDIESRLIYESLLDHNNNVSHTAKSLGLKRSTLQTKLKRFKIYERFSIKSSRDKSKTNQTTKSKVNTKKKALKKKESSIKSAKKSISKITDKKKAPQSHSAKKSKINRLKKTSRKTKSIVSKKKSSTSKSKKTPRKKL